MIALRLLGPVEARVDGAPAPSELLWRKHLALVSYLALAPDQRAGREQLAGLLWGDKPESAARQSLAEALRIIRRCTDGGVEDAGSGYIGLTEGAVETDTALFLARMEAGDPAGAASLVAGEFMQGFAVPGAWEFEEWLAGQRRSWRARSEESLIAAGESALTEGDPATAHGQGRRALELVPTSDRACQLTMRGLCLLGDRGSALELYHTFSSRLEEDLGILPAQETADLAERVRRHREWRMPPGTAGRARRGAESRRAPLVGRGVELASLVREWEACRDGRVARAVVVTGDAGTGRSRLLQELLARARLDGAATTLVRAVPADRGTDGAVLRSLARAAGFDEDARGLALADAARLAGGGGPVVLAVDDAEWSDEVSLDELVAVPVRTPRAAILLALVAGGHAGRPAIERLGASLGRDVPGAVLRLDPLSADALREMAAWAMPDYDAPSLERLTRRLIADTGGYPLFAVDLLHALANGLTLEGHVQPWPARGRTLDQTRPGDVPEPLVAAVRVGFRVLSEPAQQVLAAASVLEPPVLPERLRSATGLEAGLLETALDELEWERWLVADARGYGFVARLVREIIARDMVTPGQRRRIRAGG